MEEARIQTRDQFVATFYSTLGFEEGLLWQEATKQCLAANKDNSCSSLYVKLAVRIRLTIEWLITLQPNTSQCASPLQHSVPLIHRLAVYILPGRFTNRTLYCIVFVVFLQRQRPDVVRPSLTPSLHYHRRRECIAQPTKCPAHVPISLYISPKKTFNI